MLCWVVNYCKLQQSRAVTATNPSIRVIFRHIHPHKRDYKRALKPSPLRTAIQRFSTSYSIIMHLRLSSLVVDRPLIAPLLPFSSLGLDFRLEPLFTGPPLSLENQSTFFSVVFEWRTIIQQRRSPKRADQRHCPSPRSRGPLDVQKLTLRAYVAKKARRNKSSCGLHFRRSSVFSFDEDGRSRSLIPTPSSLRVLFGFS